MDNLDGQHDFFSGLIREEEDATLLAAGFEPAEGGALWVKDDFWFGRDAALQRLRSTAPGPRSRGIPATHDDSA